MISTCTVTDLTVINSGRAGKPVTSCRTHRLLTYFLSGDHIIFERKRAGASLVRPLQVRPIALLAPVNDVITGLQFRRRHLKYYSIASTITSAYDQRIEFQCTAQGHVANK